MKINIIYTTILIALCFVFKAQAQNPITAYHTKLESLSEAEAEKLAYLANGTPASMYVAGENEPIIHRVDSEPVVNMSVTKSSDFKELSSAFNASLKDILFINVEWNGEENMVIPEYVLSKLANLKYIYVRSYEQLNPAVIQDRFADMLQILKNYPGVEVLYQTMEQPS
ncbi:hypothetical protein [Sphingobacterium yanglingense]|uniref:Uncharacterized protein n=1 Tax=Sphingobacterium yanglingense TaxID=1437280 RepID=A0A4R6WK78_9SPHI|nr:hypothetical protein [Sphingobacterium yanglingense]TDQ76047.1 hypothetical protein CLV99_3745 [Sphingobacterium yanglingense]